jgi:hypothetical protein
MSIIPRNYTTQLSIVGQRATHINFHAESAYVFSAIVTDVGAYTIENDGRGTFTISINHRVQFLHKQQPKGLPGTVTGVWAAALDAYMDRWLVVELDTGYGIVFGAFGTCGPPHSVMDWDVRPIDELRPKSEEEIDELYVIREQG